MRQRSGDRTVASLVSGADRFGHFILASPPSARLDPSAFELCRRDAAAKRRILCEGTSSKRGQRYR